MIHSILWRRLDPPGFDFCRLEAGPPLRLGGTATFVHRGKPCRLDYAVACDSRGRTRRAKVRGWIGKRAVNLSIVADSGLGWSINGRACERVAGCDDIDLNFTPSTNTLPLRRLEFPIGRAIAVRAAWLRFPDLTLHPLDQTYRRISRTRLRYETPGGFSILLDVTGAGFVARYGNQWRAASTL